ncbi:MAG: hypothetical protein IKI01_09375 [Lachnospiraceae bacterium]|nr:hypothetical protein [Lachnospiraceae bacterium]
MAADVKKNEKRAKKPLSLWTKVIIIIGCATVFGLILSVIMFPKGSRPTFASATLQLTFEGAAEGKAPDGYAFHVDDLISDEVIEAALEASSLSGKYTAEQIRQAMVVIGGYPTDIVGQTMSYDSLLNLTASRTLTVDRFHPTLFGVKLYNRFDKKISKAKLTELLTNLLSVYQKRFARVYSQGTPTDSTGMVFVLSDYDYPQQLQILQQRLEYLSDYATEMYEREPAFRYSGSSFNDIVAQITSMQDSDIGRLNATMTLNALTRNPDRLRTQYEFELKDLSNRLERRKQELVKLDALIASYEKSEIIYISTEDSLTKIDGNSTETYDALVDIRKELSEENTLTGSKIATYRLKLTDLTGEVYIPDEEKNDATEIDGDSEDGNDGEGQSGENTNLTDTGNTVQKETVNAAKKEVSAETTQKQQKAFEADLAQLEGKIDSVEAELSVMVKAWNDSKLNELSINVSESKYYTPKFASGSFVKSAIKRTGPFTALAVILSLCMIIAAKAKEEKKAKNK